MKYEVCCEKLFIDINAAMEDKATEQMLHARFRDIYGYGYYTDNSIVKCPHCGADRPVVIKFE